MRTTFTFTLSVVLAAAALVAPAFGQTLKPGLWEVTSKMGGSPELEKAMAEMNKQLAGMSPAQRKQMEAAMGQHGMQLGAGAGGATVMKMCMSREMLESNDFGQYKGQCTTTRQDRSGNTLKMAWTCTNPPSQGEGEYVFAGPESYRSKARMTTTSGGKTDTVTMDGSGKWLGADCGGLKPMVPPKK